MSPVTNVMPGSVKLLSRGVVVLGAGEVNRMSPPADGFSRRYSALIA
jgi:hypothetical protein